MFIVAVPQIMDQIIQADRRHMRAVRTLLQDAHRIFLGFGHEDLAGLLAEGIVILGMDDQRMWGALIAQVESRPETLPADAPTRLYLRGAALRRGRSPTADIPRLATHLVQALPADPLGYLWIAYGVDAWLIQPLEKSGFVVEERVQFLELDRLGRRTFEPSPAQPARVVLRNATAGDLDELARLDAAVFAPLWHFGRRELLGLLLPGAIRVALHAGVMVGYTALLFGADETAQLARLGVHPAAQGLGMGRLLLADAIALAQDRGAPAMLLNTQTTNERALALYRSFGFSTRARVLPVLTRRLAG